MYRNSRVIATASLLAVVLVMGAACGLFGGSDGTNPDTGSQHQPEGQPPPPPPPGRVISVAGVRLDNGTPDFTCAMIRNTDAGVPVQIVDVTIEHEGDQLVREDTHCSGRINDEPTPTRGCTPGTMLPPSEVFADGCRIGVAPNGDGAASSEPSVVTLTLEATCTDTQAPPCDQLSAEDEPSGGEPVTVRWSTQPVELYTNPSGPAGIDGNANG